MTTIETELRYHGTPDEYAAESIDTCLWSIKRNLLKYGVDVANRDCAPLEWYINTGHAPTEFIEELISAKPFMISRKLHMGGSYSETIDRVVDYLKSLKKRK